MPSSMHDLRAFKRPTDAFLSSKGRVCSLGKRTSSPLTSGMFIIDQFEVKDRLGRPMVGAEEQVSHA
jgi:hypothetical protein